MGPWSWICAVCIGCRACTVACKAENDVSLGRFRTVVQEKTWGTFPNTKKSLPADYVQSLRREYEKDKVPLLA